MERWLIAKQEYQNNKKGNNDIMKKYDRIMAQDILDIKNTFFPVSSTTYDVNGNTFCESELTLEDSSS